jgi:TolB protein
VTSGKAADKQPAWSPKGDSIVFASERANRPGTGFTEIFSTTADGKNITQLTDANNNSYTPGWSPDGSKVVFASDRSGKSQIYVMDPDGQRPVLLTAEDGVTENRAPAFAPDGLSLVFASNREGSKTFQMFKLDLATQQVTRLSDNGRNTLSIMFRPEPLLRLRQSGALN